MRYLHLFLTLRNYLPSILSEDITSSRSHVCIYKPMTKITKAALLTLLQRLVCFLCLNFFSGCFLWQFPISNLYKFSIPFSRVEYTSPTSSECLSFLLITCYERPVYLYILWVCKCFGCMVRIMIPPLKRFILFSVLNAEESISRD